MDGRPYFPPRSDCGKGKNVVSATLTAGADHKPGGPFGLTGVDEGGEGITPAEYATKLHAPTPTHTFCKPPEDRLESVIDGRDWGGVEPSEE